MGHWRRLFLYFSLFCEQLAVNNCSKKLLMTGFEYRSYGKGSDCAVNCATARGIFTLTITMCITISVTRLGDLLHFGQLFKARGNIYFAKSANTF